MLLRRECQPGVVLPFARAGWRGVAAHDPEAARLIALVAAAHDVPVQHVLGRSRNAKVVLARHIAIYLLNTTLQRPLYVAGGLVGRDRKSARYACARIEDAREAPAFDAEIERLEMKVMGRDAEVRRVAV